MGAMRSGAVKAMTLRSLRAPRTLVAAHARSDLPCDVFPQFSSSISALVAALPLDRTRIQVSTLGQKPMMGWLIHPAPRLNVPFLHNARTTTKSASMANA